MPTPIAHTPKKLTSAQAQASQGGTAPTGQTYHSDVLTARTDPSRGEANVMREELNERRMYAVLGLHCEATTTALNVAVWPGVYRKSDNSNVSFAGNTAVVIPDATTGRKVWIEASSNTVQQGAAWPADVTSFAPIAEVDTANGAVTDVRDMRSLLMLTIPGTATDSGVTNQASFTIDADNAGAGVDLNLYFNRGTDGGGEDAALRWVAASAIFRLLAQHTTAARAGLDALKYQVAGSDVINSSGKLVAAAIDAAIAYTFGETMLVVTPAAGVGAPSSGTNAKGTIHVDSDGDVYVCTAAGTPGTWALVANQIDTLPAGIVATSKLSDAVADSIPYVTITSSSGSGASHNITVQVKDVQGNNLAEEVLIEIGVYQDDDLAAAATTATIDNSPVAGTWINWETTNKVARCRTDSTGKVTIDVAMGATETIYVGAGATRGGPAVSCKLIGSVQKT